MTRVLQGGRVRRRRRGLRALSTVLIVAGLLLLADAALTLAWQEPLTALYAKIEQGRLGDRLDRLARTPPTRPERAALQRLRGERARIRFLARAFRRRVHVGDPIGRIRIPSIGARYVVVEGTDTASLRKGPGHYPETAFPGMGRTIGIAGHRTTYLAPFRSIDKLKQGDRIELLMPYGSFDYRVQLTRVVAPTEVGVVRDVGYERLVMSACHPKFSAAKRIVVFSRLVSERARTPG